MVQFRRVTRTGCGYVPRARLERLLRHAWERRFTLIGAAAGYGKTTALQQLMSGRQVAWLTLTPADRDVEVLAAHTAAALGIAAGSGIGPATPRIGAVDRESLAEAQAALICEGLDSNEAEAMLVLDELEQLSDEDSGTRFLSALCLQAPPQLHLVLSGRTLPALRLGSASGRGELLELAAPDLAFTLEETEMLLSSRLGPDAEPVAEASWALTSGWVAALQLLADRLERLEPAGWPGLLAELRLRQNQVWREFASDLIEREPPGAQRIITIASVAPVVDGDLLAGLGLDSAAAELDGLRARGLMVASGQRGGSTLSPVLSQAVSARVSREVVAELRRDVVQWLEASGRLNEALECAAAGSTELGRSLLTRRGRLLVANGYGSRVAEILGELGTGSETELDMVRAEALVATGDWDGAMEVFAIVKRRAAPAPLPASTAWRFGALLYLRGEIAAAAEVLSAAFTSADGDGDTALVAAWLSSTLWGQGELSRAQEAAEVALRQADASDEPGARAAAHIAAALCAASAGARERNERHYRLALAAAAQANDLVALARIHANLSSKAVEEGNFARAVQEADLALSAGAGHNMFGAIAISNKAEALLHLGELDEARALVNQATEVFSGLGSLWAAAPYTVLGAIELERGDLVRARTAFERARRLGEEGRDVHSVVQAVCGLAAVLAQDDPEAARELAAQAIQQASALERAQALCVSALVSMFAGDKVTAADLADQAELEARRTSDRASLARALELRGAATEPADLNRLEAAVGLWRELGDPIALERAELMLASCTGEIERVEALREQLSQRGVRAEVGLTGLVARSERQEPEVGITTLGHFSVTRAGEPIPRVAWQSRKARDLLKLLASRRGRPVTRDAAAEALWPGEDPEPLSNRLSVALSTLRKVLDPERSHDPDYFIAADQQSLALRVDRVGLDVHSFLDAARTGALLASADSWTAAEPRLRQAEALYTGDFLEEDMYEEWPVDCREEARSAAQEVSRLLARAAAGRGDEEGAARYLRRVLDRDPYDGDAWTALVGAQLRMRRYGEARRQYALYARRMGELGLPPTPLANAVDTRP